MSYLLNPFLVAPSGAPSGLTTYWISGAEHESATAEKWSKTDWSAPSSIQSGITDAHGRVYFTSGIIGRAVLAAAAGTLTVRMRIRPSAVDANVRAIIEFNQTATSDPQCNFAFDGVDGSFAMRRGNTVLEDSSASLWSIDNWYDVECKVVIADSGSWLIKVWNSSATLLATLSGSGDTKSSVDNDCLGILLGSSGFDTYIDNLSIDTAGGLIGGPSRVETLYPNATGDLNQWTRGGTDTGNNWDQVNEAVKDTTSYVDSTAADQYDFYNIEPRSIAGTPKAVQVNALARAVSAGTQEFKLALRIGGVTYEASATENVTSTTADRNRWAVWSDNPATGNAWTDSEINSLQIGYKSVTSNVRVHQCTAEVLLAV